MKLKQQMQIRIAAWLGVLTSIPVALPKANYVGEIKHDTKAPTTEYVLIRSPGGSIQAANEIAYTMHNKICIVQYAASAALQIILPACKERYYVRGAVLMFHSAGFFAEDFIHDYGKGFLNQTAFEIFYLTALDHNISMATKMLRSGYSAANAQAIVDDMLKETTIHLDKKSLGDWIRPVEECTHCQEFLNTLR